MILIIKSCWKKKTIWIDVWIDEKSIFFYFGEEMLEQDLTVFLIQFIFKFYLILPQRVSVFYMCLSWGCIYCSYWLLGEVNEEKINALAKKRIDQLKKSQFVQEEDGKEVKPLIKKSTYKEKSMYNQVQYNWISAVAK